MNFAAAPELGVTNDRMASLQRLSNSFLALSLAPFLTKHRPRVMPESQSKFCSLYIGTSITTSSSSKSLAFRRDVMS